MGSGRPPGRLRGELTEFVGRRAERALIRQAQGALVVNEFQGRWGGHRPGQSAGAQVADTARPADLR